MEELCRRSEQLEKLRRGGAVCGVDFSHNRCRLIATIKYKWRMVYIRRILSHVDYDEKEWQKS